MEGLSRRVTIATPFPSLAETAQAPSHAASAKSQPISTIGSTQWQFHSMDREQRDVLVRSSKEYSNLVASKSGQFDA